MNHYVTVLKNIATKDRPRTKFVNINKTETKKRTIVKKYKIFTK